MGIFSSFRNAFRQYLYDKCYCEMHRLYGDTKYIREDTMFSLYFCLRTGHSRNALLLITIKLDLGEPLGYRAILTVILMNKILYQWSHTFRCLNKIANRIVHILKYSTAVAHFIGNKDYLWKKDGSAATSLGDYLNRAFVITMSIRIAVEIF